MSNVDITLPTSPKLRSLIGFISVFSNLGQPRFPSCSFVLFFSSSSFLFEFHHWCILLIFLFNFLKWTHFYILCFIIPKSYLLFPFWVLSLVFSLHLDFLKSESIMGKASIVRTLPLWLYFCVMFLGWFLPPFTWNQN